MRELKFRAFDTENKTWTFATLGDLICGACTEKGDKSLSGAKQVWGQYTGLKDKNGKEIYEGDIVECSFGESGAVEFRHGACCVVGDDINDMSNWKETAFEVIGNIHENAELIEKEKE